MESFVLKYTALRHFEALKKKIYKLIDFVRDV